MNKRRLQRFLMLTEKKGKKSCHCKDMIKKIKRNRDNLLWKLARCAMFQDWIVPIAALGKIQRKS